QQQTLKDFAKITGSRCCSMRHEARRSDLDDLGGGGCARAQASCTDRQACEQSSHSKHVVPPHYVAAIHATRCYFVEFNIPAATPVHPVQPDLDHSRAAEGRLAPKKPMTCERGSVSAQSRSWRR